jgi:hypothetical protein
MKHWKLLDNLPGAKNDWYKACRTQPRGSNLNESGGKASKDQSPILPRGLTSPHLRARAPIGGPGAIRSVAWAAAQIETVVWQAPVPCAVPLTPWPATSSSTFCPAAPERALGRHGDRPDRRRSHARFSGSLAAPIEQARWHRERHPDQRARHYRGLNAKLGT